MLAVNEALPAELRDYSSQMTLDKTGLSRLLKRVASEHPDRYLEVSKALADIGRSVATQSGGTSFGLSHLTLSRAAAQRRQGIKLKLKEILDNDVLNDKQRHERIIKAMGPSLEKMPEEVYQESLKDKNPLGLQVLSGSRGSKMNLVELRGTGLLFADHKDQVIPVPILRNYSEGLTPLEYWSSAYGARRGVFSTKFATAQGGFLGKQLNQIAHRLMVVGHDADEPDTFTSGLPVDTDDPDNEGSLLAQDAGPYRRNQVLSPKILNDLKRRGHDRLLVRSPIVSRAPGGGVYARDVGVREYGTLPGRGEQVGLTAAQSLAEPVSQSALSEKHAGGIAKSGKPVGGFDYINSQIQTPRVMKGGAAHAELDGTVQEIAPAPAGGTFVMVDGQQHYVGKGFALKVKKGDTVEAGDVLSEGVPNPAQVVKHKGIGEGRRYFVNSFRQAMQDSGLRVNRRNIELIARGLIDHVRLHDEMGEHVPDDVVPYHALEEGYLRQPLREGAQTLSPERAKGHYLERPVLHYTLGTKVRPSVIKDLQHFGVKEVTVHPEPLPFEPEMIRGMASLQHDPDWLTRMYGSGLKSGLLDAAHRGAISDESGTSFVPGLARAVDFGRKGLVRQPEPGTPPEEEDLMPRQRKLAFALSAFEPEAIAARAAKQASAVATRNGTYLDHVFEAQLCLLKVAATDRPTGTQNSGSSTPGTQAGTAPGSAAVPGKGLGKPAPALGAAPGAAKPSLTGPGIVNNAQQYAQPVGPGVNPNAYFGTRYQGQTLFSGQEDPQQLAQFVAGNPELSHEQGFGGSFGALARFGSMFNPGAIGALTSGSRYASPGGQGQPGQPGQQGPWGGQGGQAGISMGAAGMSGGLQGYPGEGVGGMEGWGASGGGGGSDGTLPPIIEAGRDMLKSLYAPGKATPPGQLPPSTSFSENPLSWAEENPWLTAGSLAPLGGAASYWANKRFPGFFGGNKPSAAPIPPTTSAVTPPGATMPPGTTPPANAPVTTSPGAKQLPGATPPATAPPGAAPQAPAKPGFWSRMGQSKLLNNKLTNNPLTRGAWWLASNPTTKFLGRGLGAGFAGVDALGVGGSILEGKAKERAMQGLGQTGQDFDAITSIHKDFLPGLGGLWSQATSHLNPASNLNKIYHGAPELVSQAFQASKDTDQAVSQTADVDQMARQRGGTVDPLKADLTPTARPAPTAAKTVAMQAVPSGTLRSKADTAWDAVASGDPIGTIASARLEEARLQKHIEGLQQLDEQLDTRSGGLKKSLYARERPLLDKAMEQVRQQSPGLGFDQTQHKARQILMEYWKAKQQQEEGGPSPGAGPLGR